MSHYLLFLHVMRTSTLNFSAWDNCLLNVFGDAIFALIAGFIDELSDFLKETIFSLKKLDSRITAILLHGMVPPSPLSFVFDRVPPSPPSFVFGMMPPSPSSFCLWYSAALSSLFCLWSSLVPIKC